MDKMLIWLRDLSYLYMKLMDYGINGLNGLTNSFRISEIRSKLVPVIFYRLSYIRKSSVCL